MNTFNEEQYATFTVRPVDKNGGVFTPTTARYRLDDLESRTELVGWTTLTASTKMTITIKPNENRVLVKSHKREKKVLTVEIDFGLDTSSPEQHEYWVKNLHFVNP